MPGYSLESRYGIDRYAHSCRSALRASSLNVEVEYLREAGQDENTRDSRRRIHESKGSLVYLSESDKEADSS